MTVDIWFFSQFQRLQREITSLEDLSAEVKWFRSGDWFFDDQTRIAYQFSLNIGEDDIELNLVYPDTFPDMPPQVRPTEKTRLSEHQYGKGGELCLEIRPDNWQPEILAADMIKSAYKLLSAEAQENEVQVPDVHAATLGQSVRNISLKAYLPRKLLAHLEQLPAMSCSAFVAKYNKLGKCFVVEVEDFNDEGEVSFSRYTKSFSSFLRYDGLAIKGAAPFLYEGHGLKDATIETFTKFLTETGNGAVEEKACTDGDQLLYLIETDQGWKCFDVSTSDEKRKLFEYTVIEEPSTSSRLSPLNENLKEKTVGIVGCGSVGSKIATSLARCGVGTFVLVDDDIFFDGNLVRNDLDLRYVGFQKNEGVQDRIFWINPGAKVQQFSMRLGGQESSTYTSRVMSNLANCDLILDATAEASAFNLCGSVAKRHKIPFAWVEVFEGGIGGMIARLLPDVHPVPHLARAQISDWLEHNTPDWEAKKGSRGYETTMEGDENPLIADDGDVSVIAAHMTRFVVDTLVPDGVVSHTAPVYLIGLRAAWVFEASFDTIPILLSDDGEWGGGSEEVDTDELSAFFTPMLKKLKADD